MKKVVREVITLNFESASEFKEHLNTLEIMPNQYNRPLSASHIENMAESIKTIGLQRSVVAVITNAFNGVETIYVADGQHLREAILSLDDNELFGTFSIVMNYIENIIDIIPFVSIMNSTAKNWSMKDYLNSWVTHGLEDYIYLNELHEETGYSINGLVEAFSNKRGIGNKPFKNGEFVADKKVGEKILKLYDGAVKVGLHKGNSSFLAFVRILIDFPELANEAHFLMNGIIEQKGLFQIKGNRETFFNLLRGFGVPKHLKDAKRNNGRKSPKITKEMIIS